MKQYSLKEGKIVLTETTVIDLNKSKFDFELRGTYNGYEYLVTVYQFNSGFIVRLRENNGSGWYLVFNKDESTGGSIHQAFAQVFNHLKIKVPHSDTTSSGLDIGYMVDILVKRYKFKVTK